MWRSPEKNFLIDTSAIAALIYVSQMGWLPITATAAWIEGYGATAIIAPGAQSEILYRAGANQQSLWSIGTSGTISLHTGIYISNNGDVLINPVVDSWYLQLPSVTTLSNPASFTAQASESGLSVDQRLLLLNSQYSQGDAQTITFVHDYGLRIRHQNQGLKVIGTAGLFGAMVLDKTLSMQKGAFLFARCKNKDPKWMPRDISFKDVLEHVKHMASQSDYFWKPKPLYCLDFLPAT